MAISYTDVHGLDQPDNTERIRDWPARWSTIAAMIDSRLPLIGYYNGTPGMLGDRGVVEIPLPPGSYTAAPGAVFIGQRSGASGSQWSAVAKVRYRMDLSNAGKIVFDLEQWPGGAIAFTYAVFPQPLDQ